MAIGPIQINPPGLMGLLQLKTLGELPRELTREIRPVVDIGDYYLRSHLITLPSIASIGISAGEGFKPIHSGREVPNDQWWFLHDFSCNVLYTSDNNATVTAALGTRTMVGNWLNVTYHPPQTFTGPGSGAVPTIVAPQSVRGVWVPPGTQFGIVLYGATPASSGSLYSWLRYTPLPI